MVEEIFDHDALTRSITRENFEEYAYNDGSSIKNVDTRIIEKTIESTNKRMDLNRVKY